ncbi:MAG: integrase, partial [Candidatus Hydrothermota bacterium]
GRVRKVYDMPRTPYQRVLESEYVGDEEKKGLRERHRELDLCQLKSEIDRLISKLYRSVKRKGV